MPELLIHRGLAKKKFLENSIKSFNYCFNKNYGIETDIHATKDKEFICFHDFSLKRVFKKNLSVKNLNYSKIKDNNQNSMGSAFKLGTELVAAVAVGTIIGFILDSWFDTKPWLIIIFFFLGAAAGILNVIRTANRMQKED